MGRRRSKRRRRARQAEEIAQYGDDYPPSLPRVGAETIRTDRRRARMVRRITGLTLVLLCALYTLFRFDLWQLLQMIDLSAVPLPDFPNWLPAAAVGGYVLLRARQLAAFAASGNYGALKGKYGMLVRHFLVGTVTGILVLALTLFPLSALAVHYVFAPPIDLALRRPARTEETVESETNAGETDGTTESLPEETSLVICTSTGQTLRLFDLGRRRSVVFRLEWQMDVEDWSDFAEVDAVLEDAVDEQLCRRRRSTLSEAAQPQKDLVAAASAQERQLQDSRELDQIIQIREDMYDVYPDASLALLLAEDYQLFGDAYRAAAGLDEMVSRETIRFYYYGAIEYFWEYLGYQDVCNCADRLTKISNLYGRLRDLESAGSTERSRLSAWAAGFARAA